MQNRIKATMNWDDAPDTIDPEIYSKLTGICLTNARNKFNTKNFPKIPESGTKQLANKDAVRLFDMGINIRNQSKDGLEFLILLELKKINAQIDALTKGFFQTEREKAV